MLIQQHRSSLQFASSRSIQRSAAPSPSPSESDIEMQDIYTSSGSTPLGSNRSSRNRTPAIEVGDDVPPYRQTLTRANLEQLMVDLFAQTRIAENDLSNPKDAAVFRRGEPTPYSPIATTRNAEQTASLLPNRAQSLELETIQTQNTADSTLIGRRRSASNTIRQRFNSVNRYTPYPNKEQRARRLSNDD